MWLFFVNNFTLKVSVIFLADFWPKRAKTSFISNDIYANFPQDVLTHTRVFLIVDDVSFFLILLFQQHFLLPSQQLTCSRVCWKWFMYISRLAVKQLQITSLHLTWRFSILYKSKSRSFILMDVSSSKKRNDEIWREKKAKDVAI